MKHWKVGKADNGKALWFWVGDVIHIQCIAGELAEMIAKEHNATVDALEAAEARLKSAEARVQELEESRDSWRRVAEREREEKLKLERERDALAKTRAKSGRRKKALRSLNQAMAANNAMLKKECESTAISREAYDTVLREKQVLQRQVVALQRQNEYTERLFIDTRDERDAVAADNARLRTRVAELEAEVEQNQTALDSLEENYQWMQDERDKYKQHAKRLAAQVEDLERDQAEHYAPDVTDKFMGNLAIDIEDARYLPHSDVARMGKWLAEIRAAQQTFSEMVKALDRNSIAAQFGEPQAAGVDLPSDEELRRIGLAGVESTAFLRSDQREMMFAGAIRAAVEAPYKAEIARLKHKRDVERDRANDLLADLEHERKKPATRPCRVEFDVTPGGAWDKLASICGTTSFEGGASEIDPPDTDDLQLFMSYLADHARVVVPDSVPTAEEIARVLHAAYAPEFSGWKGAGEKQRDRRRVQAQAVLDYLTPWLGQAVDPELCNKKEVFESPFKERPVKMSLQTWASKEFACIQTFADRATEMTLSPADAHRAGMWLLSFAAANGIDVRLPGKELPDDLKQIQQCREAAGCAENQSLLDGIYEFSEQLHKEPPDPVTLDKQTMDLHRYRTENESLRGRVEKLTETISTLERDLRDKDREIADLAPPPADPVTLDKLAEIGRMAWAGIPITQWDEIADSIRQDWRNAVRAILTAAKPEVDMKAVELQDSLRGIAAAPRIGNLYSDMATAVLATVNSRIRFRVADMPDMPDIPKDGFRQIWDKAEAEEFSDRMDSRMRRRQRECYERVFYAALNAVMTHTGDVDGFKWQTWTMIDHCSALALTAAVTLPERLAELDAALENHDE